MKHPSRIRRSAALTAATAWSGALLAAGAAAAAPGSSLPYPCSAVPTADVMAALGIKHAPIATATQVPNVSTCSSAAGKLTISVGSTTISNPMLPLKTFTVPGLPTGTYRTYANTTQTEILFVVGTAASGTYGVVRNFVKIKQGKLETIARALYTSIASAPSGGAGDTSTAPTINLVQG